MRSVSSNDIFDRVILALEKTIYVEGRILTPATRIVDDLALGKFGRLKLALYLEETFDVEIPDEAVDQFNTVGDIIRYMSRWSPETAESSTGGFAG